MLLAAGYATRLYPLTENLPKALLPVGDDTILGFLFGKIARVEQADRVCIVTNSRFYRQFADWAGEHPQRMEVVVLDDGTTDNATRRGAVADLQFALEAGGLDDDVLVLAGDNLFDFALTEFVAFFERAGCDCITVHELNDPEALRRTGVVELDAQDRVAGFEEKPRQPKSHWAAPPFYLLKKETLPLLRQYLAEGNNPDAPGNLIPWLIRRREVRAFRFPGRRYDIGTPESYQEAREAFGRKR